MLAQARERKEAIRTVGLRLLSLSLLRMVAIRTVRLRLLSLSLLSLSLPSARALQCVRLQTTGKADSVAAAAAALGALPVPHADGSLELVGGGPAAPSLESVVAQLQQADGEPVELAGPPEPLFESEGSTASFAPLLVSGALRIRPVQDSLPASVTSSAPQTEEDGALPLHLLDGDGVFMLTTSNTFHQSTAMLIELAVRHRAEWLGPEAGCSTVLDYGCGSGVLALAALTLAGDPSLCAHATDVNEAALVSAARNAALNGLSERLSLWMPWELPRAVSAELGFANMLPGPLISVAPELAKRTAPGARLLLSGFRRVDLATVARAYAEWFDVPAEPALEQEGWLALVCTRNNAAVNTGSQSAAAVE